MKVGLIAKPDFVYPVLVFLRVLSNLLHMPTRVFSPIAVFWCLIYVIAILKDFQIQFQSTDNAHSIHVQLLRSPPRRLFWTLNGRTTHSINVLRSSDISSSTRSSFVRIMNSSISLRLLYNSPHCLSVRSCFTPK